jgi:hypothetical protein
MLRSTAALYNYLIEQTVSLRLLDQPSTLYAIYSLLVLGETLMLRSKKTFIVLLLVGLLSSPAFSQIRSSRTKTSQSVQTPTPRQPIRRKDAFFGMHFDLHPTKDDSSLGADITEENLDQFLRRVAPDYVQYDCKGHAGYTGYPTKVGWASPGIVKDSLALWRKATRARGIGLYVHYSGVYDSLAIEKRPDWARIDADGKRDTKATSTFGAYVDELLIPQLKEVSANYDLDGLWVDGECWAVEWDYSPRAIERWKAETGYANVPRTRSDPHWYEWKQFHRRQFENYLRHWVDSLHAFNPNLQITSNWMYSIRVPKPVDVNLDFLSGDYSRDHSVDTARIEARYLASTGMPWDLMAWGFNKGDGGVVGWSFKTPVQLKQEAAVVLMQGGGFQIYFYEPTRAGYVVPEITSISGEVADFCRARQEVSHNSTSVPQVALLMSSETHWDQSDTPFGSPKELNAPLEGALHALLESHYSVDIVAEHQLQPRLQEYPLVVIPDAYKLADDFKRSLLFYVKQGGNLLLLGEKSARLFRGQLGVNFDGEPKQLVTELATAAGIVNQNGVWQSVSPTTAQPIGFRYATRDTRKRGEVAATFAVYGNGRIAAVYGPLPLNFALTHHPNLRRYISDVVKHVFPKPAVTIDGPPTVDVSLRRTAKGQLSLHLMNSTSAAQSNRFGIVDFIPEIGPIQVKLNVPVRPKRVRWEPGGRQIPWSWSNGWLHATLPRLQVHGVIVVD